MFNKNLPINTFTESESKITQFCDNDYNNSVTSCCNGDYLVKEYYSIAFELY